MSSSSRKPVKWAKSEAKKRLYKDILAGKLDGKTAREVYNSRPDCQVYEFKNFGPNLARLRASIAKYQHLADEDSRNLAHDRQIPHPQAAFNPRGYPRWEGSEAECLLKLDVNAKKHKEMKPSELRETRDEYKAFPGKVFRDHISQEVRSRTTSEYWSTIKKKN